MGETEPSYAVPPTVVFQDLGDETVLLDLENGEYFAVDGTGKRIWDCLVEGKTPSQVVAVLAAEYEVGEEVAREDLGKFVADLLDRGLLRPAAPPEESPGDPTRRGGVS